MSLQISKANLPAESKSRSLAVAVEVVVEVERLLLAVVTAFGLIISVAVEMSLLCASFLFNTVLRCLGAPEIMKNKN